jgi:enolase
MPESPRKRNSCGGMCRVGLDCAASEFYDEENKLYEIEKGLFIDSDDLIEYYGKLIEDYPMLKKYRRWFS